jgi:hypothetical protein
MEVKVAARRPASDLPISARGIIGSEVIKHQFANPLIIEQVIEIMRYIPPELIASSSAVKN